MCCNCCKCNHSSRRPLFDNQATVGKLAQSHRQLMATVAEFLSTPDSDENRTRLFNLVSNHNTEFWVWGGVETDSYPECCAVGRTLDNRWFASGVRIHRRVVLTAAHVILRQSADRVAFSTANWDSPGETPRQVIFTKEHDSYIWANQHDIGVMILAEDTPETPVFDLSLATTAELSDNNNHKVVVVGYGANDTLGEHGIGVKRVSPIDLDITAMSPDQFFAKSALVDTCLGDSGGPAYIRVNGKPKLAGITARGDSECGQGGYYTRIDTHWSFIADFAREHGITDLPASLEN